MNTTCTFGKKYQAPIVEILDMDSEGLLCTSDKPVVSVDPWGNGGSLGDYDITVS